MYHGDGAFNVAGNGADDDVGDGVGHDVNGGEDAGDVIGNGAAESAVLTLELNLFIV